MAGPKAKARVGLEILVTVVPEGELPHLGKTTNVSTTGMLLEIARPLEVGERIQLKLFLPGIGRQLEIAGEVSRDAGQTAEGHRYGVQFVDLPAEAEFEIERFLALRLEHQGPSR